MFSLGSGVCVAILMGAVMARRLVSISVSMVAVGGRRLAGCALCVASGLIPVSVSVSVASANVASAFARCSSSSFSEMRIASTKAP